MSNLQSRDMLYNDPGQWLLSRHLLIGADPPNGHALRSYAFGSQPWDNPNPQSANRAQQVGHRQTIHPKGRAARMLTPAGSAGMIVDIVLEIMGHIPMQALRDVNMSGTAYLGQLAMFGAARFAVTGQLTGCCFIWDAIEWDLLQMLRDPSEKEIEELYCAAFSADSRRVLTCGKLKSRSVWSEEDGDNFVVPGKIKVYDTVTGQVLLRMEGHQEEILSLQRVQFKSDQYWLSCGQDGRVIKWKIEDDYRSYSKQYMDDPTAHYTCALSLLPGTGNKLFATGADEGLKIFDFERNSVRLFLEMGVYHRLMRSVDSSVIP